MDVVAPEITGNSTVCSTVLLADTKETIKVSRCEGNPLVIGDTVNDSILGSMVSH